MVNPARSVIKIKNTLKTIAILLGMFVVAARFTSQASNYYVAPTGDDTSPSGTIERPFKTLKKAGSMLKQPGDVLYLRGGAYPTQ